MGRKNRKKKERNLHTPIAKHKHVGTTLVPPLATLTSHYSSWRDDHAPEMLWAVLLASVLPRDAYLACFRTVLEWCRQNKDRLTELNPAKGGPSSNTPCEIDHTALGRLDPGDFDTFFQLLVRHPLSYGALRPLLLVKALPGYAHWQRGIAVEATNADWSTLADGVTNTFDHQSQISTDVRWLKLVEKILIGKMHFADKMAHRVEEYFNYPNKGDLRSVRPSIRASEMILRRDPPSPWIEEYWRQLREETACVDSSEESEYSEVSVPVLDKDTIFNARAALIERFLAQKSSIRTDAKLDTAFGFCLYCVSLLEEVAAPPISQLILGRLGLRSLVEAVITFSYLVKTDDDKIWMTYRRFGSGQAKLAFLKLEETTGDRPTFVESETLEAIANEDLWQEYVEMELGHWADLNLRDLAVKSGTKDMYDAFYGYTSAFSHTHWCAVRDTNFTTCHNPLHRLHRIPRPLHRLMPSVVMDAAGLTNRAFDLLETTYPSMEKLSRIAKTRRSSGPAETDGE